MTEREKLIEMLMQSRIYLSREEAEAIADDICFGGVKLPVHCEDCEYSRLWTDYGTGKRGKCAFLIGYNQYVPDRGYCWLGEGRADNGT